MSEFPAVLGGRPAFEPVIPLTKPTLPDWQTLAPDLEAVFRSGLVTNAAKVREFEAKAAAFVGVTHAVAVSSCTSGLMLVLRALDLRGEVILPSYSFSATGLVLQWFGLRPRFVDIDATLNVDPARVEEAIGPQTSAILAVHIWGNPAVPIRLEAIARAREVKLIFDSAHGLGARYAGRPVGQFGDAEVFSLSPTKLVVAGEGGLVTTNDAELARRVRVGRDYGNPGTYDLEFAGLNARMGEANAVLGMHSLAMVDRNLARRQRLAEQYRRLLGEIPGLSFQQYTPDGVSSNVAFGIVVDPQAFGLSRNHLAAALERDGITTRKYYDPAIHRQRIFAEYRPGYDGRLPVTERVSANVLCLPMFSHLTDDEVARVCRTVQNIYEHGDEVRRVLS